MWVCTISILELIVCTVYCLVTDSRLGELRNSYLQMQAFVSSLVGLT